MRTLTFLLLLGLAACGSDGDSAAPGASTPPPGTTVPTSSGVPDLEPGKGIIALRVSVKADETALPTESELTCTPGAANGDGRLAADPSGACANARQNADLLIKGPPQDRVCTEIYGGPQIAAVRGTIDGTEVDQTFTRSNGCEIADWDTLQPLLGPPPDEGD